MFGAAATGRCPEMSAFVRPRKDVGRPPSGRIPLVQPAADSHDGTIAALVPSPSPTRLPPMSTTLAPAVARPAAPAAPPPPPRPPPPAPPAWTAGWPALAAAAAALLWVLATDVWPKRPEMGD